MFSRKLEIRTGFKILGFSMCALFIEFVLFLIWMMAGQGFVGDWIYTVETIFEFVMKLTIGVGLLGPISAVLDKVCKSKNIGWVLFTVLLGVIVVLDLIMGPLHFLAPASLGGYLTGGQFVGTSPSFSLDGKKIVYASPRDGNANIYIMNNDGSELTQLTHDPSWDISPSFSPEGSRILFLSDKDTKDPFFGTLYLMRPDGSDLIRLMVKRHATQDGRFSPDGSKVIFTSGKGRRREIYTVDSNGNNLTRLTKNRYEDLWPCFSPDGGKIAFSRYVLREDGARSGPEIFVMNADGTGQIQLTHDRKGKKLVSFSPDSRNILYSLPYYGGFWIVGTDGSEPVLLSEDGLPQFFLPDGRIVFRSHRAVRGEYELYSMSPDGKEWQQLTHMGGRMGEPSSSSNGEHIVFLLNHDGRKKDIYIMNSDGSNPQKIGTNY